MANKLKKYNNIINNCNGLSLMGLVSVVLPPETFMIYKSTSNNIIYMVTVGYKQGLVSINQERAQVIIACISGQLTSNR